MLGDLRKLAQTIVCIRFRKQKNKFTDDTGEQTVLRIEYNRSNGVSNFSNQKAKFSAH